MRFLPYPAPPTLFHGGDYNPDQWLDQPAVIDDDFRLFPKAGVNVVSIGIFAWATLEPEEGRYDFAWLDRLMDRLHQTGMRAILATPSGAKPAWMAERYPEVRRVDGQGRRDDWCGRHNHCFTSPVYRTQVARINRALAERYGQHPALLLWHVSNEYSGECHCGLCKQVFRDWLKARYGTIEELNRRYWSRFWSHTYPSFDHVVAIDGSVPALALDWKRFTSDQTANFLSAEIAALRGPGPTAPVTTNLMGLFPPLDSRRLVPHLDVVSWDSYPAWHQSPDPQADEQRVAAETAFTHDLVRCLRRDQHGGQPFLLLESTPTNVSWMSVSRPKRPGMHRLSSLQAVAHGSDSVCYFQWRKGRGGCEKFHGAVVDHVGHEHTRVFRDVATLGSELAAMSTLAGTRILARVAVIHDWESLWAIEGASLCNNQAKHYLATLMDHYRPLWSHGIAVDVIGPEDPLNGYTLVIAPMLYQIRPGVGERLTRFVDQGGTLVTGYWSGITDQDDQCVAGGYPGPLRAVTGVWAEETDPLPTGASQSATFIAGNPTGLTGTYPIRDLADTIHPHGSEQPQAAWGAERSGGAAPVQTRTWDGKAGPCDGVAAPHSGEVLGEVVATYDAEWYAGTPAVTRHRHGQGEAWYVAARFDDRFHEDFLGALLARLGISGPIPGLPAGVTAHARTDNDHNYAIVANWTPRPQIIETQGWRILIDHTPTPERIELPSYGVVVLERQSTPFRGVTTP